MIGEQARYYRGYGNCARCGDRWPILFVHQPSGARGPDWIEHELWMSEAAYAQLHAGGWRGNLALCADRLKRRFGFSLAIWPEDAR